MIWRCNEIKNCPGRAHTMQNVAKIEAKKTINLIKEYAITTVTTTRAILRETSAQLPCAVVGQLPNIKCLKKTIQRSRKTVEASPANHQSYNFEIPNYVRHGDNGNYDNRILLFSTEKSLNVLRNSDHWFSDGTFSSCPNLFGQLYTIHAVYSSEIISLVYVLLPDKKEVTYNKMFQALKTLNQAVWRKIQNYGLTTKYIEDVNFELQVRKLIAFIPINKVVNYFEVLLASDFYMENENVLTLLITYFETTWIGILDRRGRRRQPQYPIKIWNCSERLQSDLPKINNSIEGWHNAFSALINCKKPVIWKFISALQRDESLTKVIKEQLIAGYAPTKKNKYK
ncbi:hypothetical protein AGLY_015641 [Aphis glycines]|uniref:MULE transposase domain-containing protein n=1 Tax=Aphis glycines TaxID=307491 RepID=A0A6G0T1B5_APHGL|nr:hypothetical protein AGLY_015641 [Aphis glycines]